MLLRYLFAVYTKVQQPLACWFILATCFLPHSQLNLHHRLLFNQLEYIMLIYYSSDDVCVVLHVY